MVDLILECDIGKGRLHPGSKLGKGPAVNPLRRCRGAVTEKLVDPKIPPRVFLIIRETSGASSHDSSIL